MKVLRNAVLYFIAVSYAMTAHAKEAGTEYTCEGSGTTRMTQSNTWKTCGKRGNIFATCGKRVGRFKRIVGGSDAEPGMFPWIAALGYRGSKGSSLSWRCVGSLVTDRHLLTTAHCLINRSIILVAAKLGTIYMDDTESEGSETFYAVDNWIKHPDYSSAPNSSSRFLDIGIVWLKRKVEFSSIIQPICLPTLDVFRTRDFTGTLASVAGWGRIYNSGPFSTRLQHTEVRVWEQSKCTSVYEEGGIVFPADKVICAGDNETDSCTGDSGGPLMVQYGPTSKYYVMGIVSYGIGCAHHRYPGVNVRVSEFIDWILLQLKMKT